jgi:hypothetical protein
MPIPFLRLIVGGTLLLTCLGCHQKGTVTASPIVRRGTNVLVAEFLEVVPMPNGRESRVMLKWSVANRTPDLVPRSTVDLECFLDEQLIAFDRAMGPVQRGASVDYTQTVTVGPNAHKFTVVLKKRGDKLKVQPAEAELTFVIR